MSRRRYISTDMSADGAIADLTEYGLLPVLLYTWAIPHMDDWGRMSGEARQFKLLVCPGLDVTVREVDEALQHISDAGLWMRYEFEGKRFIAIKKSKWFKYQSYIAAGKRDDDHKSTFPRPPMDDEWRELTKNTETKTQMYNSTPQNTEDHQITESENIENAEECLGEPQMSASPSLSPSPSPSKTSTTGTGEANPFKLFESEGFGTISSIVADMLGYMIDEYGERWVCEAMKAAVIAGKRSLSYVEGILKRYKSSGIDEPWKEEKPIKTNKASPGWSRSGKPQISIVPENTKSDPISPEKLEELRKLARKIDGKE